MLTKKCAILKSGVDNRKSYAYVGAESWWEISVP